MNFSPRHPQPFTVQEAAQLEIPVITHEIARLQLSLKHLQSTQEQLQEHLTTDDPDDKDIKDAFDENKIVIASQQERILMLRFALQLKGGTSASNPHYDTGPIPSQPAADTRATAVNATSASAATEDATEGGGIFL